jgi:phospholipase/carboxylesterase
VAPSEREMRLRDRLDSAEAISRRRFLTVAGAGAAAFVGCRGSTLPEPARSPESGRLGARPFPQGRQGDPGEYPLGLGRVRDGLLYVPRPLTEAPAARDLILALHGAGGSGARILQVLRPAADQYGFIVLAPDSRGRTWDAVTGQFGPDIPCIDRALRRAFAECLVDPRSITVAGFSDGAGYALSLGLTNGDLFSRVLAFSPCFVTSGARHGRPAIFVSHGARDSILPIDRCGRRIVEDLRTTGYRVRFREFDGGHTITGDVLRDAMRWMKAGRSRRGRL